MKLSDRAKNMKQITGVLLLASIIGLAIAATSSARTDDTATSCAEVKAQITTDVAAANKAAHAGDFATELRISKEIIKLTATAKTVCAASETPAEFSASRGLLVATLGKPYMATTFCTHIVSKGTQCDDADGKLITFTNKGDLLPLGMRLDSFTGTISGTPRVGQSTEPVKLQVCWHELLEEEHCFPPTNLVVKK